MLLFFFPALTPYQQAFKVVTKNAGALHAVVGKLKLDGCRVRSFHASPATTHVADCVYLSHAVSRPFLFSEMALAGTSMILDPIALHLAMLTGARFRGRRRPVPNNQTAR